MKLSSDASKVLKELSSSISLMKTSPSIDLLVREMNGSALELQNALSSLPDQLTQMMYSKPIIESEEGNRKNTAIPLMDAMPLMTMTSLLIELTARIQGLVEAVGTLAKLASFKSIGSDKYSSKVQAEEQSQDLQQA